METSSNEKRQTETASSKLFVCVHWICQSNQTVINTEKMMNERTDEWMSSENDNYTKNL